MFKIGDKVKIKILKDQDAHDIINKIFIITELCPQYITVNLQWTFSNNEKWWGLDGYNYWISESRLKKCNLDRETIKVDLP